MIELALALALLALILAWRAHTRIRRLEAALQALTRAAPPTPDDAPPAAAPVAEASRPRGWGPAVPPATPPAATPPAATPPEPAGPGALAQLGDWLRANWIYPAAGAALVLSGVFLVQYAVESGLLTPQARVVLALILGAALILAGEAAQRRATAGPILPATLAGSGIVVAMAAVLAALHLYAMIGPAAALIALALLAFLALALGARHGPMLAGLGLVAGSAAPFALGGGGPPPAPVLAHFALLALAGLAIGGLRRWGWVCGLAVAAPGTGMILWRLAGADPAALALALTLVAAAAMAWPFGRIAPVAEGAPPLLALWQRGRARAPGGAVVSLAASTLLAGAAVWLMPGWEGPLALTALAGLTAIWARRAPVLADQMVLPVLALPGWIIWQGWTAGPVLDAFLRPRPPESALPLEPTLILALAVLGGLALVWRGAQGAPGQHAPWTLAGLALPFGAVAALETLWEPARILGPMPWAGQAMALAALATALALYHGARDGGQGARLGAAAAMAFALIALALALVIGQAALTLALAVLMVAAAALDRRLDIPGLGLFQVLASLALAWRLVLDPGLAWHASDAPTGAAILAVLVTLAGPALALWLVQPLPDDPLRRAARLVVETGLVAAAAIGAGLLLIRLMPEGVGTHATLGPQATALIALAWVQIRRSALPPGQRLRRVLAWAMAGAAALALAVALTLASPVTGGWPFATRVAGWPILNDLIPAYLIPGLTLVALARPAWLKAAGWALAAVWAGLAIRHLWQGADLTLARGIAQGELYAYTIAALAAGAVLVGRAVTTGRADLRRLGLALVGLAAAKAFLIDAAGLGGLLRVGAFLALGLSLAGLAWLNGWAQAREAPRPADPVLQPS